MFMINVPVSKIPKSIYIEDGDGKLKKIEIKKTTEKELPYLSRDIVRITAIKKKLKTYNEPSHLTGKPLR